MLVETDVKMPIHITNRDKKFYLPEISRRLEKNVTYDRIYSDGSDLRKPDLIVTDMQYPLTVNSVVDKEAGFKLIERMKKEQIDIPVIICSEANYVNYKEVLGTVWYREEKDIYFPFKEVLERLE